VSRTLTVLVGAAVALSLLLVSPEVAPRASADANAATALGTGPGGTLWLAENQRPYLARVDPSGHLHPARLPVGYSFPVSIVTGPDGALWVADEGDSTGNLLRYASSGAPVAYPLPAGTAPSVLAVGPDHALWFTDRRLSAIGRMTTAGRVTMYPLPTRNAVPDYIAVGPDGALWFTELKAGKIGRIDLRGRITERAAYVPRGRGVPADANGVYSAHPTGIVAGPDGNLWFTEQEGFLVRLSTAGRQTPYHLPASGLPSQIVVGADKALWVANGVGGVVRADTSGHMIRFPIGTDALVVAVAVASDGSVWFSDETGKDVLGCIAHGRVTAFPAPPVAI